MFVKVRRNSITLHIEKQTRAGIMNKMVYTLAAFFMLMLFAGCEGVVLSDDDSKDAGKARLTVRVGTVDIMPFGTRVSLGDVSTRLSYALFNMNGEKVANTKTQQSGDGKYGTIETLLEPDTYVMVTIAHNGLGNCTISSPTEVKFANNKMTDTFASCDTLTVKEGSQTIDITLERRVAMVRLVLGQTMPREVKKLNVFYTGGSSTYNPSTGYGSVNSRQTEVLTVPEEAYTDNESVYEVYTLPHADEGTLNITLTALGENDAVVAERELQNVPVQLGFISRVHCTFTSSAENSSQIQISVGNTEWGIKDYNY